jgi:mannose-6-phosphate isomerase-like protein (cupin superfamily)
MKIVDALVNYLSKYQDFEGKIGDEIRSILEEIDNAKIEENGNYYPNKLPVCNYLPNIIENLNNNKSNELTKTIFSNKDSLKWQYGYEREEMTENMINNFAYTELIGTDGIIKADNFTIGLVLMGPNTFYPSHYHSTKEIYFLLYGKAHWYYKNNFLGLKKEGELIYHDSNAIHAMKTFESPMLSLFTWTGAASKTTKFFNKALEK